MPLLLALVAILLIGGGVYIYANKKTVTPIIVNNEIRQSDQNQQSTSTQSSIDLHTTESKWIGTSYCWNAQPADTKEVGNYNNLHLVMTKDGEELWAISILDQRAEFLNNTKDCPQVYTVRATLKFPPIQSGLTLAIGNCKGSTPLNQIVDLVDKEAYMTYTNPLTVLQPTQAWRVGFDNPAFEPVPVSEITCYSNEPDPY